MISFRFLLFSRKGKLFGTLQVLEFTTETIIFRYIQQTIELLVINNTQPTLIYPNALYTTVYILWSRHDKQWL